MTVEGQISSPKSSIFDESNILEKWIRKLEAPQIRLRATVAGLAIGSMVLISNFQFGLQTGWVSMMSLPSALLGFAIFKMLPISSKFSDVENVYVQSLSVAVGTGPLAFGLIGVLPAIEKFLTKEEAGLKREFVFSFTQLLVWCFGFSLFGVFFAIPLRKQVILKENLPFPSGRATATLISVLHRTELKADSAKGSDIDSDDQVEEEHDGSARNIYAQDRDTTGLTRLVNDLNEYQTRIRSLVTTFSLSASYTLLAYFFPFLRNIPIFGRTASVLYKWNFQPSPAYIGQGIIMGLPTVSYMLIGSILGWAILAPLAKHMHWAEDDMEDNIKGPQGWILWVSLSIMISDSIVSFAVFCIKSAYGFLSNFRSNSSSSEQVGLLENAPEIDLEHREWKKVYEEAENNHNVSSSTTIKGIIVSSLMCVFAIKYIFGSLVPIYAIFIAITFAFFFSILAVRALGETDLNPVSGIGKLSQLLFALVIPSSHPSRLLINLIAGAITEAGAQQAGDLMQDLVTGHLIGASPKAQFIAQLIGTFYSIVLSSVMYVVYNKVYKIPNNLFRIPTAIIWIDCARLVTGEGLPPKAFEFCIFFGIIFACISLIKNSVSSNSKIHKSLVYLPNGVAVGIGIYNTPNFTIARFLGGVIGYVWINHMKSSRLQSDKRIAIIIFSSGLVLGEGLLSVVVMLLTSLDVKHF